ncbi:MAG TPA: HD domain-containing phosphohydrolase [Blastocatellia bacterium]|nr:HD domain-containing phosphohydrolase [Blastocatellia bacterium]
MEWLKDDLKRYTAKGIILLVCLTLVGGFLLARATAQVATSSSQHLLVWLLLTLIVAKTSSQHALKFFKNGSAVSFPEAFIFLAVVMLGPYHGALLGAVDMFLSVRRLRLKPTNYLINLSSILISVYASGKVYYAVAFELEPWKLTKAPTQGALIAALPIVAMAFAYYVLQFAIPAMVSVLTSLIKIKERIRDTFPWEPMSLLACAIVAGLINYSFVHIGLGTTGMIMLALMPIPIVIYYTFKTYHDKLDEQDKHYQKLTSVYDSILEMLAMAIDAKDDVTHDHIQRVKLFARRMGEAVGLSELEIEALKAGALLHDIGKIGVPAYILNKPGKLTEHEFEQMKVHTIIGADMLSNVDFRYPVVPIVRHHHERWDGRGYPDGLKGEGIPITARILTLVDNYDALRSDRPYKTGMTREAALAYIKENAGTFFDPSLVETFLGMADQLELEAVNFIAPPTNKPKVESAAMANARPAAGFDTAPQVDRAAAALNSIAETNQRVTALYEMSRTLSSILSLEDTVAILTNRLSKLIPFTTCAIALFDPSRSEFEIVHATGLHAERFMKRRMPAEAGITGWVITNQRPMYNTNPVLDLGFLGAETASAYKGVVVFPLIKNSEPLGAIALYSTELGAYGSEHIQLMESISQPASDAIRNALTFEQAQRRSFTDAATGMANERALITRFEREQAQSRKLGTPLSLIVVNVNQFGFASGDGENTREQALAQLCRLTKKQVRETDLVARYESDSLIALLPDSGQIEASGVCSRIGREIVMAGLAHDSSVSVGAATSPDDGDSFENLLRAARTASIDCAGTMSDLAFLTFANQHTKSPS